jgi:hypothetical protein
MKRTLVFGMAAWTLAACASAEQDMQQADRDAMAAAEAQEFLADTTQYGRSRDGNSYVVYRAPDGEIRGRAWGSWGESFDTGSWSVDENGVYCAQWTEWRDGRRGCWRVYEEGNAIVFAAAAGDASDFDIAKSKLVDGNAEGL